jgi:class 3 adenylate cyclase
VTDASFSPHAAASVEAPPPSPIEEPVGARAAPAASTALARLLFEIRRVPRPGSRITAEIEGRVLNRCLVGAVEVLSAAGAAVELARTPGWPVVEAGFDGPDAAARAAKAADEVLASVRRVQRAAENEFQVVGALTVGTVARTGGGVAVTTASSEGALHRLRERAAPGQILLSKGAFEACRRLIHATPLVGASSSEEAYLLEGLRSSLSRIAPAGGTP